MTVIDERGRLFGRVNIIDAAVGLLLVALLVVSYGAYALFQQPEPRIVSIEPAKVTPTTTHVRVIGENLRPFMRVYFNEHQGVTFGLISPELAEVRVPQLSAGTYDVILYDVAREANRLRGAVTVETSPLAGAQAKVLIAGAFVSLNDSDVAEVRKGAEFSAKGDQRLHIVETGTPQGDTRWLQTAEGLQLQVPLLALRQVHAMLRAPCKLTGRRCSVGDVEVDAGNVLSLFTLSGRPLNFLVSETTPDGPTVEVDLIIRFVLPSESASIVRPGDRDQGHTLLGNRRATVMSVGTTRRVGANASWRSGTGWTNGGDWELLVQDGAALVDVTLRAVLDVTSDGRWYRGRIVRVGSPFVFQSDRYQTRGWVVGTRFPSDQENDR